MAFSKKTWKNRLSEFPSRRKLTHSDDTEEYVNVERAEGEVTEAGDSFNAGNMNDLEERIEAGFSDINGLKYEELTTRDGSSEMCSVNANFLTVGYLSVFKFKKQVTVRISGVSSKSSADWIIKMNTGYRPYSTDYFDFYLGGSRKRGYIDSSGLLYLEELNTTDNISATITFNIA